MNCENKFQEGNKCSGRKTDIPTYTQTEGAHVCERSNVKWERNWVF